MAELNRYLSELEGLLRRLEPAQIRALSADLGKELRRRNAVRIRANISPQGVPFVPRKGRHGRPLRPGEAIRPGQPFLYLGRQTVLRTIKTPASAANPSRPTTQSFDSDYVHGWDALSGRVRKLRRDKIELPARSGAHARMFRKINQFRYLKFRTINGGVEVGYWSGLTAYIAAAHQYGTDNRPERILLGYSDDDLRYIHETVVRQIAG